MVDASRLQRKLRVTEVTRPVKAAHKTVAKSTEGIMPSPVLPGPFRVPWLRVFRDFSLVVRRVPRYNAKTGHGSQSVPVHARYGGFAKVPAQSHDFGLWLCHFGWNPTKPPNQNMPPPPAPKYKAYVLCESLVCPSRGLQPRQETVSVNAIPSCSWRCHLLSLAMPSNAGMATQTKGHRP